MSKIIETEEFTVIAGASIDRAVCIRCSISQPLENLIEFHTKDKRGSFHKCSLCLERTTSEDRYSPLPAYRYKRKPKGQ